MTDMTARNMQLLQAALDKDDLRYYTSSQHLIAYAPCKSKLQHRGLRPTSIKVRITPHDNGILYESSLPVALESSGEDDKREILRLVAKQNYGTIRGSLVYLSDSDQLQYRIFCPISEDAAGFNDNEATSCLKLAAESLSVGYEAIINALDDVLETKDMESTPESINEELEALFERLLSSESEEAIRSAMDDADSEAESESTEAESTDTDSDSNGTDYSALRSLLDGLLSDDTQSD